MSSDGEKKKGMTRRDFFKGAAVAGAAVAGSSVLNNYAQAKGSGHWGHPGWGDEWGDEWQDEGLPLDQLHTYGADLERLMILRSSPIGIKMLKDRSEIPEGAFKPRNDKYEHYALCQAFGMARRQGRTMAMFIEDHWCFETIIGLGQVEPPQSFLDGMTAGFFIEDPIAAKEHAQEAPRLPYKKYIDTGMVFGPLKNVNFVPDLVMIYCNTGQLRHLILALGLKHGYLITSTFYGIGSCTRSTVPSLQTGEAYITVPDPGEYERAMTGEDIMILTLPARKPANRPGKRNNVENLFEDMMYGLYKRPYTSFAPSMWPNFPKPGFYNTYFSQWGLDPPVECK
jgi:uncharacterized protein (DUF169 family)